MRWHAHPAHCQVIPLKVHAPKRTAPTSKWSDYSCTNRAKQSSVALQGPTTLEAFEGAKISHTMRKVGNLLQLAQSILTNALILRHHQHILKVFRDQGQ